MKKSIFHVIFIPACCHYYLIILFISLFVFSSCSSNPQSLHLSEVISLHGGTPILEKDNLILCCETITTPTVQNSTTSLEYFTVDIHSGERDTIGVLTNVTASSGDVLLAPDGNVYLTYQTAEHPVSLYKTNLESEGINLVYESSSSLPFQFLSVLDENNLVLFEPDRVDSGYTYRVIIYNLSSKKATVVLERSTDIGEVRSEQISSAYAYNGEIYCLMHTIGGEYRIDVLDSAGIFNRTIYLDSNKLREASTAYDTEYGVWRIYVTDGIVWFKTLADTIVPFSISSGTLCGDVLHGYAINTDISNSENNNVLLYRPQKSELSLFSGVDGSLTRYDLSVEKDGKSVSVKYAFSANSSKKIFVIPWDSEEKEELLLYDLD